MKQIIYYTHNLFSDDIEQACRKQLLKSGVSIVSVSLNKKIDFGDKRITVYGEAKSEMIFEQVLVGLKASSADTIFFCEADVLYHPSHFDFTLTRNDTFFYNTNVWRVHYPKGLAVWVDNCQQTSGCCADRKLAIAFYERRIKENNEIGFNRRYEANGRTGEKADTWLSAYPNLDIRHGINKTGMLFTPEGLWNSKWANVWKEAHEVNGWGNTKFDVLARNI